MPAPKKPVVPTIAGASFVESFDPKTITNARQRTYSGSAVDPVKAIKSVVPDIDMLKKEGNTLRLPLNHFLQFDDVKKDGQNVQFRSAVMKVTSRLNSVTAEGAPWAGRFYSVKHYDGNIYVTRLADGTPKKAAGRAASSADMSLLTGQPVAENAGGGSPGVNLQKRS